MLGIQEQPLGLLDHLSGYANDLDTFATWLAGKAAEWGDLPEPYLAGADGDYGGQRRIEFNVLCFDADTLAAVGRLMAAGAPVGSVRKEYDDRGVGYVRITRTFGTTVVLEAWAERDQVCERIEDGVETVEIVDPEAPKITVERPRFRWECRPVFQGVQA